VQERNGPPAGQPTPTPGDSPAAISFHWIMTVQTNDGRQGTNDGRINAVPGMHTRATTYTAVRKAMEDWMGTAEFTVVFFSLGPDEISAPVPPAVTA